MSDAPIPLKIAKHEPDQEIIEMLRMYLIQAKAGEISGLILLAKCSDGSHQRRKRGDMSLPDAVYLGQLTVRDAIDVSMRGHTEIPVDPVPDDEE